MTPVKKSKIINRKIKIVGIFFLGVKDGLSGTVAVAIVELCGGGSSTFSVWEIFWASTGMWSYNIYNSFVFESLCVAK